MLSKFIKILTISLLFVLALSLQKNNTIAATYTCGGQIQCLEETGFGSFIKYNRSCAYAGSTCTASCDPGDAKISTSCSLTCQVGSSWKCPNAAFNCSGNQEKWCDDCGGVDCKSVGGGGDGGGGGGGGKTQPPNCGTECSPGGVKYDGCGSSLSCAPDIHCTAGDQYKGNCGNPGAACGPKGSGGYCYRVCWGPGCGGGGGSTCNDTSPGAVSLVAPASGANTGLVNVKLKWNGLSDWGQGCPSNDNKFKVFVTQRVNSVCPSSGYSRLATVDQGTVSYTTSRLELYKQYCWYILSDNGSLTTSSAVWWFSTDKAPTASITAPATNTYFQQGTQISFSGTASDVDSPLNNLNLFRIDENINHNIDGNWIKFDPTQTCTTQTCAINRSWTPASNEAGCWDVRIDAVDSVGGTCSGYPGLNSSWVDCQGTDYIKVCVNAKVQGWIWDSTSGSCKFTNKGNKEIKTSEATGVNPYIVGPPQVNGIWDPNNPSFDTYSYKIDNVRTGSQTLCAQPIASLPGFRYTLTCTSNSTALGGSCAPITVYNNSPTIADLGYTLTSTGWFTSFDGDVFGGFGSGFSVVNGVPSTIAPTYVGYLVKGLGTVFGIADLSVKKQPGNTDVYSEDNNRYVKNTGAPSFWPANYNLIPPSGATLISSCSNILTNGNLNPTITYKVNIGCLQPVLNSGNILYKLKSNGIVVIYVTGNSGSLTFKNNFQSNAGQASKRRILFVTTLPVIYGKDIGYLSPPSGTRPLIESAVITSGGVSFPTKTTKSDPTIEDSTIMVEGPIIAKVDISFNRDRKTMDKYPAEVVKYNALYLDKLSTLELSNGSNKSGLFLNDAVWEKSL